jgi:hypothetical protein
MDVWVGCAGGSGALRVEWEEWDEGLMVELKGVDATVFVGPRDE